jgi:hypothetical protein
MPLEQPVIRMVRALSGVMGIWPEWLVVQDMARH